MKRTYLKRKPVKRRKKTPEAKLKEELWELCKQIIRKQYGNTCYTCGAINLEKGNWQTGHFIPRSICGFYLKFDLRNLRPQCYRCNISLTGNGAIFYKYLVEREGQRYVDEIFFDRDKIIKANKAWFQEKIKDYTQLLAGLTGQMMP